MTRLDVLPAATWADWVAADLAARLRAEPDLRLCLPTGDTPSPVYERLAAADGVAGDGALFGRATIVLLDEYLGLAPDDPARCDARLRRELLDRLDPPPAAFHAIDVDGLDPAEAARRHDAVAARGLDLTLLGLGMNGHVGLNEPGARPDDPTRVVDVAASSREVAVERYGAGRAPTGGITLGIARLLESREIWLLVTGERKAGILRRVLEAREGSAATADSTALPPAAFLLGHPNLRIVADEDAAHAG